MAFVKRDPTRALPAKKKPRRTEEEREAEASTELSLPTDATLPENKLGRAMFLLYGERKIGKTELASRFGNAFFLATEVGYKGLRVFKRDVTTWKQARGYARLLTKDTSFDTIVVDTADLLYDLCMKHVCEKLGITHPNDEAYGKGWHAVKKEFEKFVLTCAQTGKGLIIISHGQEKEVKTRDGSSYDRMMPTMAGQARQVIEGMVDVWACFQYLGRRRVLTVEGDDHVSAGHRFGDRFRTPDGERLRHIDMGRSSKEGYRNLQQAWENEYAPKRRSDLADDEDSAPTGVTVTRKKSKK